MSLLFKNVFLASNCISLSYVSCSEDFKALNKIEQSFVAPAKVDIYMSLGFTYTAFLILCKQFQLSLSQPSAKGAVQYCLLEAGLPASGNYPVSWW